MKKRKEYARFIIFAGKRRYLMPKNQPMELGLKYLNRSDIVGKGEHRFITPEFGFVNSMHNLQTDLFHMGQPYRVKEGRIVQPICGDARISVNLTEYTLSPGNILLISPGSIIELLYAPPKFDVRMVAPNNDFIQFLQKDDFARHYLSGQLNALIKVKDDESKKIEHFFSLMWELLQEPVFQRETIQSMLTALFYYIENIRKRSQTSTQAPSRQEELFQRFIALANTHCKQERNVGFYAGKLCLTPRYLNTVIKQVSGQTVMDWINQAIILEAKVLLKHSNQLIYQISDELQFATPSFFCKFFKKMTGMTPQEYQKK